MAKTTDTPGYEMSASPWFYGGEKHADLRRIGKIKNSTKGGATLYHSIAVLKTSQ